MNPSPTGSLNDGRCTADQILRYLNRISGPFLDRIDLQVDVPKINSNEFSEQVKERGQSSKAIRQRVIRARDVALARSGKPNTRLGSKEVQEYCLLSTDDQQFLQGAVEKLGLSLRTYHRVLKVSRTIADLAGEPLITRRHLAEALNYRAFDRMLAQLAFN